MPVYKVGIKSLVLDDKSRANWLNQDARPLNTEIWYPVVDDSERSEFSFGSPEPLYRFDAVARNADLNPEIGHCPLILLSHGTGGSALQMGWLARRLAGQGYIAVAVNHHGNNSLEPYLPQGFLLWWERALDLTRVLDHLLNKSSDYRHCIDPDRIGVAGFSLGGYTAIELVGGRCSLAHFDQFCASPARDGICDGPREFPGLSDEMRRLAKEDRQFQESLERHYDSYRDERLKAAFLMAPALGMSFSESSLANIKLPVAVVVPEIDSAVPPATNGHRFAALIDAAELTVLKGPLDHYVFLCEATEAGKRLEPEYCVDHPSVNRRQVHRQVAEIAVEFFNRQLNIRPGD